MRYFQFREKTLAGQAAPQAALEARPWLQLRGMDCVDATTCLGTLNWAVGQLYSERHFPAATKASMNTLIADLTTAFRTRIQKLDWMSAPTKAEALKKLDTFTIKVGYPDKPRDYSNVVIRRDDLLGNVRRAAAANWAFYANRSKGAGRQVRLADDPADQQRLQRLAARHRLPGGDPPGADLRSQRRPGVQLWRGRRSHRP